MKNKKSTNNHLDDLLVACAASWSSDASSADFHWQHIVVFKDVSPVKTQTLYVEDSQRVSFKLVSSD
jgi:hypothetical protein